MADIFAGRGPRQFGSFPQPQFGRPARGQSQPSFRRGFDFQNDPVGRPARRGIGPITGSFFDPALIGGGSVSSSDDDGRQLDEEFTRGLFRDDPGFAFNTAVTQAGLPRNLVDFFRRESSQFLARFQGALGNELDKFGTQTLNPLDFFRDIVTQQEFQRFSPRQRDPNSGQFNRASRILF